MKDVLDDENLIYLITDGETDTENFPCKSKELLKLISAAVDVGVSLIQLREKKLPARLIFQLAVEAVKITKLTATKLLINDRADIAKASGADGVHLTANSIPTEITRQSFPGDFIIGVSTHTRQKARMAQVKGADFAVFSPIFDSPGKGPPQGIEVLHDICENLKPFPIIALGGINETNFTEALAAGAKGIAGIRLLSNVRKLTEIVGQIQAFKRKNG